LGFFAALMAASLMLTAKPDRAADFTVTSANGFGQGTSDQAIRNANALPGADTIKFNSPEGEGGPVRVIFSSFGLPAITDPVTIEGSRVVEGVGSASRLAPGWTRAERGKRNAAMRPPASR
jgi:hypothetical protein